MANSFKYKEIQYKVGDTLSINYRIKEGDKERLQLFKGILVKIKGDSEATRMITVRKMSKSGIGIERIIPLSSPFIATMKLDKKSNYKKAKLYFIRNLSEQELKSKLYQVKKVVKKTNKTTKK
ncbi:MAG: 50S ribosomal protein L19 [Candidatus Roizmanbacteria bacterium GW2011_GWA2_35_19]|uniref:50S ribosomal protein L19 n=2 Tax=Candidatus Roizmaniibacteriota TaxID=1752723 RepID=A0A0G0BVW5_9BACT|nr:MAG: 50S ribosomal protein L19 [Candidatus Roizmanbacteria bacterium GW2011_GWC2_35_12]KKP73474.1 MAG: 50S ribosomal protein L19 [Candidatus Roizmanbacteria bacterium GW2011_GWA2_35_19]